MLTWWGIPLAASLRWVGLGKRAEIARGISEPRKVLSLSAANSRSQRRARVFRALSFFTEVFCDSWGGLLHDTHAPANSISGSGGRSPLVPPPANPSSKLFSSSSLPPPFSLLPLLLPPPHPPASFLLPHLLPPPHPSPSSPRPITSPPPPC